MDFFARWPDSQTDIFVVSLLSPFGFLEPLLGLSVSKRTIFWDAAQFAAGLVCLRIHERDWHCSREHLERVGASKPAHGNTGMQLAVSNLKT